MVRAKKLDLNLGKFPQQRLPNKYYLTDGGQGECNDRI